MPIIPTPFGTSGGAEDNPDFIVAGQSASGAQGEAEELDKLGGDVAGIEDRVVLDEGTAVQGLAVFATATAANAATGTTNGATINAALTAANAAGTALVRLPAGIIPIETTIILNGTQLAGVGMPVKTGSSSQPGGGTYLLGANGFTGDIIKMTGLYSGVRDLTSDAYGGPTRAINVTTTDCWAECCTFAGGSTATVDGGAGRMEMSDCFMRGQSSTVPVLNVGGPDWIITGSRLLTGTKVFNGGGMLLANSHITGPGQIFLSAQTSFVNCYIDGGTSSAVGYFPIVHNDTSNSNSTIIGGKIHHQAGTSLGIVQETSTTSGVSLIGCELDVLSAGSTWGSGIFGGTPNVYDYVDGLVDAGGALGITDPFPAGMPGYIGKIQSGGNSTGQGSNAAAVQGSDGDYGNGTDGAVTFDGTTAYTGFSALSGGNYTLSRDVNATRLAVNPGVTVFPNGFRMLATQSIVNGYAAVIGNVTNVGTAITATVATAGPLITGQSATIAGIAGFTTNNPNGTYTITVSGTTITWTAGSAPTGTYGGGGTIGVSASISVNGSKGVNVGTLLAGTAKATGTTTAGPGAAGTAGTAVIGGAGGAGGSSVGGANAGGAGGTATAPTAAQGGPHLVSNKNFALVGGGWIGGAGVAWQGGTGGGAGAGDGTNAGGSGGTGAGIIVCAAPIICNNGLFLAQGQNGTAGTLGNTGGGGGGGGGAIILVCKTFLGATPVSGNYGGGTAGGHAGTGVSGSAGAAGMWVLIQSLN